MNPAFEQHWEELCKLTLDNKIIWLPFYYVDLRERLARKVNEAEIIAELYDQNLLELKRLINTQVMMQIPADKFSYRTEIVEKERQSLIEKQIMLLAQITRIKNLINNFDFSKTKKWICNYGIVEVILHQYNDDEAEANLYFRDGWSTSCNNHWIATIDFILTNRARTGKLLLEIP